MVRMFSMHTCASAMRKLVLVLYCWWSALLLWLSLPGTADQSSVTCRPFISSPMLAAVEAVTKVVAAGTVQPVVSVVVGSQVSGQVKEILADHNDAVKEGQPIALLDPELFNTRVEQARAEVDVASDAVRIAQGEVTTAEAAVKRRWPSEPRRRLTPNVTRSWLTSLGAVWSANRC